MASPSIQKKQKEFRTKIDLDHYLEQQALTEYREFVTEKLKKKKKEEEEGFNENQKEDSKMCVDVDSEKNKIQGYMNNYKKWHGNVMVFYSDKTIFKGTFKNGIKESGIQYYLNGDIYEGHFENDKKSLKGILKSKDTIRDKIQYYDGYFESGFKEYQGNLVTNKLTYMGEFNKGKRQGKGNYVFKNGVSYWG